jgi:uncharacterized membrane protein YedE/YeeE
MIRESLERTLMKKQKQAFGKFRKLVVAGTIAGLGTVVAASGCSSPHGRHCANDGSSVGQHHCGNNPA